MIKTIFYRKDIINNSDNSFYFSNKKYYEWKTLEDILYNPVGPIISIVNTEGYLQDLTASAPLDMFTDEDIIRRIFLW